MTADVIPGPGWSDEYPADFPPSVMPRPDQSSAPVDETARVLEYRLPFNDEAEMALLGAILHDNRAFLKIAGHLQPQDFANRVHGKIFEAAARLIQNGQTADPITLKQHFAASDDLNAIGGFPYLMTLAASLVSVANVDDYARVIETLSRQRQAMQLAAEMIATISAGADGKAVETALPSTVLALDALSIDPERGRGLKQSKEHTRDYIDAVAAAAKAEPGQIIGVPTGLTDLDRILSGIKRGGLTVLGARPSMGKSLLALSIASHALTCAPSQQVSARRRHHNVAIFSLEMSGGDVIARRIAARTGIPILAQRRPGVSVQDFDRIADAGAEIADQPLWIDDRPGLTAEQIRLEARRLHRAHPLDLIVVDYLQIMGRSFQPGVNPVQQIGQMTRALRALAKETGAAVLLLSQLSRGLETRDDKRPQLSDLRESGDIEQDADVVLLLFREAYYLERSAPQKRERETESDYADRCLKHDRALENLRDKLDIIVAKNRDGGVGTVRVRVDLGRMVIADLPPPDPEQGGMF